MSYKLLGVNTDSKTSKGTKFGFLTGICYLAPAQEAGGKNICAFSTAGCRAVCLFTAGRGAFTNVRDARIRKTKWWLSDPLGFKKQLIDDTHRLVDEAAGKGLSPVVRLNGTSDILWEREGLMEQFPTVQWMDYTKYPSKLRPDLPSNYHLTYSFSEAKHSEKWSWEWAVRGFNTAAVFSGGLPDTFLQRPVIDGDLSDLRFLDPQGVIVGLKTKGKARGVVDAGTGFVQLGKAA